MKPRVLSAVLHGLRADLIEVDDGEPGTAQGLAAAVARRVDADVSGVVFFAGVSTDGRLAPVHGVTPATLAAQGARMCIIVAPANGPEAAAVGGADVREADTLDDVLRHLAGGGVLPRPELVPECDGVDDWRALPGGAAGRAVEVAAAGGHGLLIVSPESGEPLTVAHALVRALPPLSAAEALEATCVASVAGLLGPGRSSIHRPPLRSVHHTVSAGALTGVTRIGEATLAHAGVLVLHELPEFRRAALDALAAVVDAGRAPLADGDAPARFVLAATMQPCPCGREGHPQLRCTCSPQAVERYMARLRGPLLHHLDVHVRLPPVRFRATNGDTPGEPPAAVQRRVQAARDRQRERGGLNARMPPTDAVRLCDPDATAAALLRSLARAEAPAVLRVARTLADLAGAAQVQEAHVYEALAYGTGATHIGPGVVHR